MEFVSQALKSDTKWTDVNLIMADGQLTTHACLLSAISPVLKAALEGDFKESSSTTSSGGRRTVQLMTITCEAMQRTLDFCFNHDCASMLQDLSCQEAIETLAASHYLQIPLLSNKCADVLLAGMTVNNCADMVRVAESFEQATLASVATNMQNVATNQGHTMTSLLIDQRKVKLEQQKCRAVIKDAQKALSTAIAKSADIFERINIEEQRIFEAAQAVLATQRLEVSKNRSTSKSESSNESDSNLPAIHFPSNNTATLIVLPHKDGNYQVLTDAHSCALIHPRHRLQFDSHKSFLMAMRDPDDGCVFVDSLGRYANLYDAVRCAKPGDSIMLLSGTHCVDVEIGLVISKQVHISGERETTKSSSDSSDSRSGTPKQQPKQPILFFGRINVRRRNDDYSSGPSYGSTITMNYILANSHLHLDNITMLSRVPKISEETPALNAISLGKGVNLWMEHCTFNMSYTFDDYDDNQKTSCTIRHLVDVKETSSVWLENSVLHGSCSSAISIDPQATRCHITGCYINRCGRMDNLPTVHIRVQRAMNSRQRRYLSLLPKNHYQYVRNWKKIKPGQKQKSQTTSSKFDVYKTPAVKVLLDGNVIEANHGAGVSFAVYHKIAGWYWQSPDYVQMTDYEYEHYEETEVEWYKPQTIAKYWDVNEFLVATSNNTIRGNNMSVEKEKRNDDGSFYSADANYNEMELTTFVNEDSLESELKKLDNCGLYETRHIANGDGNGKLLLIKHICIDQVYEDKVASVLVSAQKKRKPTESTLELEGGDVKNGGKRTKRARVE